MKGLGIRVYGFRVLPFATPGVRHSYNIYIGFILRDVCIRGFVYHDWSVCVCVCSCLFCLNRVFGRVVIEILQG